jgi:acid stress-induced BolA-like protein IbaG/YrbA
MELQAIEQLISNHLASAQVTAEGDGYHFQVTVVSAQFAGLSLLKRQQLVYAALNQHIASGAIHAISIKTHTPEEWSQRS